MSNLSREVNKDQIDVASAVFWVFFQAAQPMSKAPSSDDALGSLFTNLWCRGIVRAVCRLGDSGTTAR